MEAQKEAFFPIIDEDCLAMSYKSELVGFLHFPILVSRNNVTVMCIKEAFPFVLRYIFSPFVVTLKIFCEDEKSVIPEMASHPVVNYLAYA